MKRSSYSKEDLARAVDEYNHGAISTAITAKYGIPGSTIRNHKLNPKLGIGSGRPTLLSNEQEKYLVELLKNLEVIGVRLTKPVVIELASDYVKRVTDKVIEVGRKWLNNFLERWRSELKVVKEEKMELARRNGFTEDVRCGWFDKLNLILQTNDLIKRPHAIYNCDESGFSDETACEMVIVSHATKYVYEQSGGSGKSFTTNLVCVNAAGEILPPFIIYAAKNLNPQWTFGGPPGSQYAVSESGWITKDLFFKWFKWFVDYTQNVSKPVLLIMDNHACHISIEVIEMAKQNQILLLLLPPHCTHSLQPLDTVTFSAAKKTWKPIVSKYFSKSGRKTIRKLDLPSLFNELYTLTFTPKQVVGGFTRAGVWPFDPTAMKDKVARQPLATKQLNQLPLTASSTNIPASSTQAFLAASDTCRFTTSSISPSSSDLPYLHDQHKISMALDFNNNHNDEPNRISNENISIDTPVTTPKNNLSFTTNLSSSSLSSQVINIPRPPATNHKFNTSRSSSLNAFDLLQLPSFSPYVNLYQNSSNHFDLSFDKSNNVASCVDLNSTFKQHHQSTECISHISMNGSDIDEEDDGQDILGYNPYTFPTTHKQNSHHWNDHRQQQYMSIIDFERDGDEVNRIYTDLVPVHTSSLAPAPRVFQPDQFNLPEENNPVPSSPSTAVRSIVTDLFRQHAIPPPSSSKTNKRIRTEGKYGEEITSSNILNELKEKASKPNPRTRVKKSTKQTTTTNKRTRKLPKGTNETITSSQATRALSTIQIPTSTITIPNQYIMSSDQTQTTILQH